MSADFLKRVGRARRPPAIDRYLGEAKSRREAVSSCLRSQPELLGGKIWSELLPSDSECVPSSSEGGYPCKDCETLSRLSPSRIGRPFLVECGKEVGTKLVVAPRYGAAALQAELDPHFGAEAAAILATTPLLGQCGYVTADRYLICDPVTSEVLVRQVLAEGVALPSLALVTAYSCGSGRHHILHQHPNASWPEWCQANPKLKPGVCLEVALQLVAQLKLLAPYHFTAGSLDASFLGVVGGSPSVKIDGVHIQGKERFSICWSPGSSLTVEGTRICCADLIQPGLSWVRHPKLQLRRLQLDTGLVTLYKLDAATHHLFLNHRRAGVPLYPGSLEIYLLILTLLSTHPDIGGLLSGRFLPLLRMLWVGEADLAAVIDQVEIWRSRDGYPSHLEMVQSLLGRWLRCDALELVWRVLTGKDVR